MVAREQEQPEVEAPKRPWCIHCGKFVHRCQCREGAVAAVDLATPGARAPVLGEPREF